MSARGAKHGVAPAITPAVPIRVGVGTFTKPDTTTVTNPQVSATGGAGGQSAGPGVSGVATNSTGGGGAGGRYNVGLLNITGSAGTCFSGGSGGGGAYSSSGGGLSGSPAQPNGGTGGSGQTNGGSAYAGGGAGNSAGFSSTSAITGGNGTGGTLFVICEGDLSGTGKCTANGVNAPARTGGTFGTSYSSGGGSGGGCIFILYKTNSSGVTANTVTQGIVPSCQGPGGQGGAGSINKLQIP